MILVSLHGASPISSDTDVTAAAGPARCCSDATVEAPAQASGSRRRRLWELESHAHCPVIGVCLPIGTLRGLYAKHCGADASSDDYQLHCDAMAECRRRTALADALQHAFDRRYALAVQQSARARSGDALAAWWDAARRGPDLAGAVWATITHARCSADLQHRMLGEVHMRQHQVGAAQRVDHARFDATLDELSDARREIAALQERLRRQAADHAREREDDASRLRLARADLLNRDAALAALRDDDARPLATSRSTVEAIEADDRSTAEARRCGRIAELEEALAAARSQLHRLRRSLPRAADRVDASPSNDPTPATLDDRAVLCVGGRPASVPLYRRIVEQKGGRFLHHDGGDEENVARLDATLAAADLVICQTGCVSHDAYWRVKDHCKRTGKTCVFVENPGSASLRRALAEVPGAS